MQTAPRRIIGHPARALLLPLVALFAAPTLSAADLDIAAVAADDPANTAAEPWAPEDWTVRFEPMLWVPGLRADLSFPGSSTIVTAENLNLDEATLAPGGELYIKADKLTFSFTAFGFFGDETHSVNSAFTAGALTVAAGERVNADVDITSFDAILKYQVWQEILPNTVLGSGVALSLDVGGGIRVFDVDSTITAIGGDSVSDDGLWAQPILAVTFSADLLEDVSLDVALTGGGMGLGDQSSFSAGINAGVRWRFMDNAGLQIGFRHLSFSLSDGEDANKYELEEASLSGMYGGVSLRF